MLGWNGTFESSESFTGQWTAFEPFRACAYAGGHSGYPDGASGLVEFTLEPQGDSTNVTWVMQGPMLYISKLITVFVNMDSMVGKDFEAGLANLKTVTENQPR